MRLHKKTRMKRMKSSSPRARKSRRSNIFDGFKGSLGTGAIVVAVISVVAVAMLLASHGTPAVSDLAVTDAQTEMATPVKNVAATSGPAKRATADPTADTSDAAAPATVVAGSRPAATIEGCLERAGDGFRLIDTAGDDAPKSRSWKSGFLHRGNAAVEVSDPTHGMRLANHVGQRVSVTGMLNERQMEVWSLRRVSATCE